MPDILIVDDHALIRAGVRTLLEPAADLTVVGEAANGAEAVDLTAELSPDVVLMDLDLPGLDGIEVTRALLRSGGDRAPAVLILTGLAPGDHVVRALEAGAAGFLLKQLAPQKLISAVRTAALGGTVLSSLATRSLLTSARPGRARFAGAHGLVGRLNPRELEVMRLIGRGMSNAEIAATAHLSLSSVKTHISRLLTKLCLANRTQVALLAYELGLIDD